MKFFCGIKRLAVCMAVLLIFGCGKEAYNFEETLDDASGKVEFALSADHITNDQTKAAEQLLNVDDFTVEIFNSKGVMIKRWLKFSEVKGKVVKMNKGEFKAKAYFGDSLAVGYDVTYYAGLEDFFVNGQTLTPVAITCRQGNVQMKVVWGENIKLDYTDYSAKIYREGEETRSVTFSKEETRSGFLPAGTLLLEITLKNNAGESRVYTTPGYLYKPNDCVTFNIDTKPAAKEEVEVTFEIDNSLVEKPQTITVPATLVAKPAPKLSIEGFQDDLSGHKVEFVENVGVTSDLYVGINAPAYVKSCLLESIESAGMPSGWPASVDLADQALDPSVVALLKESGLEWSTMDGKYATVDFKEFIKRLRIADGNRSSHIKMTVTDTKGKSEVVDLFFDIVATIEPQSIENSDIWATKCYVEIKTDVEQEGALAFESFDGLSGTPITSKRVSRTGDISRYELSGLAPGSDYTFRVNYNNGFALVEDQKLKCTTEEAIQLKNGDMEQWTKSEINGGNGTWSASIDCDYVTDWNTRNEKTTAGAVDASGWSNYGVNWRWCSGTVPTSDKHSGSLAAEISTLAFYNKAVRGSWNRNQVYTYTRDDGTAYAGYLFTGSFDKGTDSYTLGIPHQARPDRISFYYKYAPSEGDKCTAYAVLYDSGKREIARTQEFHTAERADVYTEQIMKFEYTDLKAKAAYIAVFFKSGDLLDITKMSRVDGSYDSTPFNRDRVVGSVLKVDDITLVY